MDELTHFNKEGLARMVDVSNKQLSSRIATAMIEVHMASQTIDRIKQGTIEKGNVLAVATTAAIMGAKKTSELIPMCHQIPLTSADIEYEFHDYGIEIKATVKTNYGTGVEMEALTACNICALTIYDMVKAIDKKVFFTNCKLLFKCGGKSGEFHNV